MLTLQQRYQRTASILNRKYILYMIPALLSAVGVSLSEFADTMVVGQLLSERALPIVNLASPIAFMASRAKTTSCRGMFRAAAICSTPGSRPFSAVSFSLACSTR